MEEHLVCKVEAETGRLESLYKKQKVCTTLVIGACIRFERNGIVTEVTRQVNMFEVRSYQLVA